MIVFFTTGQGGMGAIMTIVFIIISKGLVIINPNFGAILLLFGQYEGSIKESGLFWINPCTNGYPYRCAPGTLRATR